MKLFKKFFSKRFAFTLVELIITIVIISILAALAMPKLTGIQRNAKVSAMIRDIDTLEKVVPVYYTDKNTYPLLTDSSGNFTKVTAAQDLLNLLKTIGDDGSQLYAIDLDKTAQYHSKLKYGYKTNGSDDFYVYSMKKGNVYYMKGIMDGKGKMCFTYDLSQYMAVNSYVTSTGSTSVALKNAKFGNSLLLNTGDNTVHEEPSNNLGGLLKKGNTLYANVNGIDVTSKVQFAQKNKSDNILEKTVYAESDYKTFTIPVTLDSTTVNTVSFTIPEEHTMFIFLINIAGAGSTAPVVLPSPTVNVNTETQPYTLTVTNPPGVTVTQTEYKLDSSAVTTTSPNLSVLTPGQHTIDVRIKDDNGNYSDWVYVAFTYISNTDEIKNVYPFSNFSLVLKSDNSLWSMGLNNYGQLGVSTNVGTTTPVKPVRIMDDVKTVSMISNAVFVLKNDNSLWSFGLNQNGNLGISTNYNTTTPVTTPTKVMDNVKYAVGNYATTYILLNDGSVWAAGYDYNVSVKSYTPKMILSVGARDVYVEGNRVLIIKADNSLWGAGANIYGQLGIATNFRTSNNITTLTKIMDNVSSATLGRDYTYVIKTNGDLVGFGWNYQGQLGTTSVGSSFYTPVTLATNVKKVVTSYNFLTLWLKNDNTVYSIGCNIGGGLGHSSGLGNYYAYPIKIATSAKDIAVGDGQSYIIKLDNTLWTCGNNKWGQLGYSTNTGTNNANSNLVQATNNVSAVYVPEGGYYAFIIKADNKGYVIGSNYYGQIGSAPNFNTNNPLFTLTQWKTN